MQSPNLRGVKPPTDAVPKQSRAASAGKSNEASEAPGIAEAAAPYRHPLVAGARLDRLVRDDLARTVQQVEGHTPPATLRRRLAVHPEDGGTTVMHLPPQLGEEHGGQPSHVRVDAIHADAFQQVEAGLEGGDAVVVRRPVLEGIDRGAQLVRLVLHRDPIHGATGKPRAAQLRQRPAPRDQRADAGGDAEQLVERDGDEVGAHGAKIEAARRDVRGRIEQHRIAQLLRIGDERQWVPPAREVGLRRKGEEAGPARDATLEPGVRLVELERGRERNREQSRPGTARKLARAIHRVVVVGGEHEAAVGAERKTLRHELARRRRVGHEAHVVLGRVGIEKVQHPLARATDAHRRGTRRRMLRVRIAEDAAAQERVMGEDLRRRRQRGSREVEVCQPLFIEHRELASADRRHGVVERLRRGHIGRGRNHQHPRRLSDTLAVAYSARETPRRG